MRTGLLVLIVCAATDVAACMALLLFVWRQHCRQRREAVNTGEPPPPAATGSFVFVGLVGGFFLLLLYGAARFLLLW